MVLTCHRTAHKRNTKNPEFDNEFFEMGNLPVGTTFFVEVRGQGLSGQQSSQLVLQLQSTYFQQQK